jgi:glycosyltransferase involved in cell wall biosynthesis
LIFIAARMESWKGHVALLRAVANLKTSVRWRLLVAGAPNSAAETDYYDSLRRETSQLGLVDHVQFLGYRSDIPDLMSAADIYCQPNQEPEPFGIVYVEALHAGVPVVTSGTGGAREILNRDTGILVEPGKTDALTAALTQLIDNRDQRLRLGNAGPARASALCKPEQQLRKLNEILQSVVYSTGVIAS